MKITRKFSIHDFSPASSAPIIPLAVRSRDEEKSRELPPLVVEVSFLNINCLYAL